MLINSTVRKCGDTIGKMRIQGSGSLCLSGIAEL